MASRETTYPSNLIIIVTYRCEEKYSRNEHCEWLVETLLTLIKTHKDVVIMGDFNSDLLIETKHSRELLDIMKTFNLKLVSHLKVTRELGTSRTRLLTRQKRVIHRTITDHYYVCTMYGLKSKRLFLLKNLDALVQNSVI